MRTTRFIYALIDVRDNSVRYVGVTKDAFARLGQHMQDADKNTPKGLWLAELRARGLYPRLEILETITGTRQRAYARERHWTVKLLQNGEPLVETTATNNGLPL